MTDEQIMIDGVNVGKCRYFLKDTEGQDYDTDEFVKGCCEAKGSCIGYEFAGYGLCRGDKDCYYKQLKRKEQEYEELRQYHNKCCEEFEKEKQNLIDRYNQFSKDFFIGKYCKKEYCDLLKAKEQECERLKWYLKERSSEDCRYDR